MNEWSACSTLAAFSFFRCRSAISRGAYANPVGGVLGVVRLSGKHQVYLEKLVAFCMDVDC
jgi:hypothetical protein